MRGTLSNTTPSTGRGGQFFQLMSLSLATLVNRKNWPPSRVEGFVLLKVPIGNAGCNSKVACKRSFKTNTNSLPVAVFPDG